MIQETLVGRFVPSQEGLYLDLAACWQVTSRGVKVSQRKLAVVEHMTQWALPVDSCLHSNDSVWTEHSPFTKR
ncbi:hypothetical protein AWH66_2011165 [Vibrio barjaei]|nr:hypothetical protein AWH66_2011165 [Vibrio barjaei]